MKKAILSSLLFSLLLVLGACGGNKEVSGTDTEVSEYKIGAIYSKTGPNAPLGEPNGMQLSY